jgi:hypothetical protein
MRPKMLVLGLTRPQQRLLLHSASMLRRRQNGPGPLNERPEYPAVIDEAVGRSGLVSVRQRNSLPCRLSAMKELAESAISKDTGW